MEDKILNNSPPFNIENNIEAFIDHYDHLKALLRSEFNQPPDTAIVNLYQQCLQDQDKLRASDKNIYYQPFFKNNWFIYSQQERFVIEWH